MTEDDEPKPKSQIDELGYFFAALLLVFGGPLAVLWAMILLLENC